MKKLIWGIIFLLLLLLIPLTFKEGPDSIVDSADIKEETDFATADKKRRRTCKKSPMI